MFDKILTRYNRLILDHPAMILVAGLVATAWFFTLLPRLEFSSTSEEFFISNDPDKAYYEKAKELFGNDQVLVVAMVVPEGESVYTRERLARLDRLTRKVEAVDGVQTAVSLSNDSR